jgi:hypothetical protein
MSFPNSGTTYTNHFIQQYTKTTTATNYGQEQSTNTTSVPIFSEQEEGPYYRYPTWTKPSHYVLTKTHCGGECDACQIPTTESYISTVSDFEIACRSGKRIVVEGEEIEKVHTTYTLPVKGAVHLIRNPFDNIVARLHLKERRWKDMATENNGKYQNRIQLYNNTKDGFRAYCQFRDKTDLQYLHQQLSRTTTNSTFSKLLLEYATMVPCHADFVRYTRWHNMAIELIQSKELKSITLFYEEYESNWNVTTSILLDFLELQPANGDDDDDNEPTTEEFIAGKHYVEFYEETEIEAAKQLVRGLASKELNRLLQHYFT